VIKTCVQKTQGGFFNEKNIFRNCIIIISAYKTVSLTSFIISSQVSNKSCDSYVYSLYTIRICI